MQLIKSLYSDTVLKLSGIYSFEESRAIADRLFEHFFYLTPVQRVMAGSVKADPEKISAIGIAIGQLLLNAPLQYVTGKAYFIEMEFFVNPSVLIPRPETEELVSLIIKDLEKRNIDQNLQILDIGTGSGCISIALKHYLPAARVTALDISDEAIMVAIGNAGKNNTAVEFLKLDVLDESQWNRLPEYDLVVSNPPYVTQSEKQQMLPNVIENEPHIALFVPDEDPLVFYRSIFSFAKIKLRKTGTLWLEINESFGEEMKDLALEQGFEEVNIIFDFHGKSRFLQCIKLK